MEGDRSSIIKIGGEEYELILTTRATKQIGERFGGLEKLGEKLVEERTLEESLDDVLWLIKTLANQAIMIHNLWNPEEKRELITEEKLELMTRPVDFAEYKGAIMNALIEGTRRDVKSEDGGEESEKNG